MPLSYGARELTDKYYLYDRQISNEINLEPKCKFLACDYISQRDISTKLDNLGIKYTSNLTIKALIKSTIEVNVDDIVYSLKTESRWRIVDITIEDDNQMKRNSLNARQYVIITLVK